MIILACIPLPEGKIGESYRLRSMDPICQAARGDVLGYIDEGNAADGPKISFRKGNA
jgi:hypothetical protein